MLNALVKKREIFAWLLYDFSSSAFGTSIVAVLFNQYFATVVAYGDRGVDLFGWHVKGATFFALTLAVGTTLMALASPILGAMADYSGSKKKYLVSFWFVSVFFTATLYFVREGDYWLGALLFLMACFGYYGSLTFYNAFLLEISTLHNLGRLSGWGNFFGFWGGGLMLAVNLLMVKPDLFGLPVPAMGIPEVTLSVSLWMLVFALPTVIWLRERASAQSVPWGENFLSLGFRQACKSLQRLRQYKALSRYILAYMLFNDGITTAMLMASIFGAQVLGMKTDELILFFLLTQGTGLIGSVFFGFLADRIGHRTALLFTLIVWSLLIVWAFGLGFFGNAKGEFWVIGFLAGIALGGNLAVSRSLFGIIIPREHAAEFFGFLGLAGRFAAILGPIIYGFSLELTGSLQQSILALLVFFVVGGFLLLGVNERDI